MNAKILLASVLVLVVLASGCVQTQDACERECDAKNEEAGYEQYLCIMYETVEGADWVCEENPDAEELSEADDAEYLEDEAEGPEIIDTDNDGLSDMDEETKYHTDSTDFDTDGDGLRDGDEVNKYDTDPNDADSDNDGVVDGDEVTAGTDPNEADADEDDESDSESSENAADVCSDSDGGDTPKNKGHISINGANAGKEDYCEDDNVLVEYYCNADGTDYITKNIACEPVDGGVACSNGECVDGAVKE